MRRSPALNPYGLVLIALLPFSARASAADFSGSFTATSDYVFRGISQTDEGPAAQLGLKLAFDRGFYASAWASNVDYGRQVGSDAEVDYVVGWNGVFDGDDMTSHWALDLNLTRYTYPGTRAGLALDYHEIIGTLTLAGRWFATLGYSNDVFARAADGTWLQLGARWPLSARWTLEAAAARYLLDDALGEDYSHGVLSAIWTKDAWTLRASGHVTDSGAERRFGALADSRVEAAATWNF